MDQDPDRQGQPRPCLLGTVRIAGAGTSPFPEREAAAARRLLVLLVLEANPLTLDYLRSRLFDPEQGEAQQQQEQLAAEIRRARSAIAQSLGDHAPLIDSPHRGETALDLDFVARTDLLLVYEMASRADWPALRTFLNDSSLEALGGVSEFPYVHGSGGADRLRLAQLCAEHRDRLDAIRQQISPSRTLEPAKPMDPATDEQPGGLRHLLPGGASSLRAAGVVGASLVIAAAILAVVLLATRNGATRTTSTTNAPTSQVARATVQRAQALAAVRKEITGGPARTWTDYTTAGGTSGSSLRALQVVSISCRVRGFRVQPDNNPWWYLIASSPYDKAYFVTADAFYNRPHLARGSFKHSLMVDRAVPACP